MFYDVCGTIEIITSLNVPIIQKNLAAALLEKATESVTLPTSSSIEFEGFSNFRWGEIKTRYLFVPVALGQIEIKELDSQRIQLKYKIKMLRDQLTVLAFHIVFLLLLWFCVQGKGLDLVISLIILSLIIWILYGISRFFFHLQFKSFLRVNSTQIIRDT